MISDNTIQQVKSTMVTYEVISRFVSLKKSGVNYSSTCPFHEEKTPSFTVSLSKNMYKCFGCGKSGDGITFLIEHEKMSYIEAIKYVADMNNIQIEETVLRKDIQKPSPRVGALKKATIDYFRDVRHISEKSLLELGITESKEWMPKAKKEIQAICFNFIRDGEVVNIKFRGKNKDFKLSKDAELIFYNLDSIKDANTAIITEGEVDCLSIHEVGFNNVVSVPNGANINGNIKLEYLDNCWKYFVNKEKVFLLTDNDAAGNRLRDELARRIGYEKCYVVSYPSDCKDSNQVLVEKGKDALVEMINDARKYPLYGEITMDDMYETVVDFYENGYPSGCASEISPEFDELLKFYPGQLTIITGVPGAGKSEFVDLMMASLSRKHGWNWGICSFECDPPFHVTKLAEKFTDKSFAFRKNPDFRINNSDFEYAISMIDKHFHFMNLSIIDISIDGLISKAEEFVLRYGINGFLFDPWNCIEAKEDGTNYILQCLNKLISFLEKYKVHGFLVAHPTKLKKDLQTKKYEIPNLYSISGSAHFFNRTHNGISVYRDFETNQVDIYVQKVKFSWLGKIGYCSFQYDTLTRRYKSI